MPTSPLPPPNKKPHRWFNGLFIASALVTAGLFWAKHRAAAADGLGAPVLPVHTGKTRQ